MEKEKISYVVDVENANKLKDLIEEELKGRIRELEGQLAASEVTKLREENQKLSAEVGKLKKSYANVKHAVFDFVGKAKEKARESFAEGFCFARKQVLNSNPGVDLSSLDSRACPPHTPDWFSWKFLKVDEEEESSSSFDGSPD